MYLAELRKPKFNKLEKIYEKFSVADLFSLFDQMIFSSSSVEIQQFMKRHCEERIISGKEIFEIRIGIHSCHAAAGIVGIKKFVYDILGDTVNIASRMESSGEAGKINISRSKYELVKEKLNFDYRGEIEAKGKGKVKMYFVTSSLDQG